MIHPDLTINDMIALFDRQVVTATELRKFVGLNAMSPRPIKCDVVKDVE